MKRTLTFQKDKEDQRKYYLSYPEPSILDMKWENRDSNAVEWSNNAKFPLHFILRLMECLTPNVTFDIFMDNYFTFFRLLTHLGVNNIQVTCVLNKNRLRNSTIIGDKQLQKKGTMNIKQKRSVTLTVVGQNSSSAIYIASSKACEPK